MSENITPRIDLAFKKIFGVEENKDLTISLINAIVSPEDHIAEITLLNPYNPQNFANDKLSILDIKAKSETGKYFNIEIQISDEADYDKRALYYWAKLYTEQLKSGEDYGRLAKAIGIHILNFTSIPKAKKYHNIFHLKEKEDNLHYFKDMELHTIELNKFEANFPQQLNDFVLKIKDSLDIWSAFLTRHNLFNPDRLPPQMDNPTLKKALSVLQHINLTPEEREAYENREKWLRIETNTFKKHFNDGKAEGKTEEKIEMVKKMLKCGISVDTIAQISGLSCAEIKALEKCKR